MQLTAVEALGAVPAPTKPYVVLEPAPSSPFQAAFDTVTALPDCRRTCRTSRSARCRPTGSVNAVLQRLIIALPALTVTAAW